MQQVAGRALWLGHAGDTRQPRLLLDAGVAAVVELADSEPLAVLPRELVRCRFPLCDGGGNPPWLLRLAAETVAALVRAGVPTLVCRGCGMSRSVGIAAVGVGLAEGRSLKESAMIELRDDQLQALDAPEPPPVAFDPRTGQEYLLIKREVYELVRGIIKPFNKGVEDDPEMDVYEQFRKKQ